MKLIDIIDNIENALIDILCKKVNHVRFRKQRLSFKILHALWYVAFSIPRYLIWLFTKRLICLLVGCSILDRAGGFIEECLRCEAWEEFGETSEHKLIKRSKNESR